MNLREASKHVLANAMAGNAVLLRASSGVGKTSMIEQMVEKVKGLNPGKSVGYCRMIAATHNPVDLIGTPWKGEHTFEMVDGSKKTITITDPSVPLWMISTEGKPAFCYDIFITFFDEYGKADVDVKKLVCEIMSTGELPPWKLPIGSIRVAATNSGSRYGETKRLDYEISRMTEIEITGDVDVWLSDFADKPYVHEGRTWQTTALTKAWARQNPTILFEREPEKQGPWCNPRSLCANDRYLQVITELNNGEFPIEDNSAMETMAGRTGMPATTSYLSFAKFRTELPSYDDVVADPQGCRVPTKVDLQVMVAYELAGWTKSDHLAEALVYMGRMPTKDMIITFVHSLLRRDYKQFFNVPAMQAWVAKNAAAVSVIASLAP